MGGWTPPFCGIEANNVECPKCSHTNCVRVRESGDGYFDASDYEAYCDHCHVRLTVWASVEIAFSAVTFSDAEAHGEERGK